MCLAIPGKIVKIEGDIALISYPGETQEARIVVGEYSVGDYVFVSEKIIVQKISEKEALQSLRSWKDAA